MWSWRGGAVDGSDNAEFERCMVARWNACADALAVLDDLDLNGPTARDLAAQILRNAIAPCG
jgi:hypothetical protein